MRQDSLRAEYTGFSTVEAEHEYRKEMKVYDGCEFGSVGLEDDVSGDTVVGHYPVAVCIKTGSRCDPKSARSCLKVKEQIETEMKRGILCASCKNHEVCDDAPLFPDYIPKTECTDCPEFEVERMGEGEFIIECMQWARRCVRKNAKKVKEEYEDMICERRVV